MVFIFYIKQKRINLLIKERRKSIVFLEKRFEAEIIGGTAAAVLEKLV